MKNTINPLAVFFHKDPWSFDTTFDIGSLLCLSDRYADGPPTVLFGCFDLHQSRFAFRIDTNKVVVLGVFLNGEIGIKTIIPL